MARWSYQCAEDTASACGYLVGVPSATSDVILTPTWLNGGLVTIRRQPLAPPHPVPPTCSLPQFFSVGWFFQAQSCAYRGTLPLLVNTQTQSNGTRSTCCVAGTCQFLSLVEVIYLQYLLTPRLRDKGVLRAPMPPGNMRWLVFKPQTASRMEMGLTLRMA